MIPLFKRLWRMLLHDEQAVRRWGRSFVGSFGVALVTFADQVAGMLGNPGWVKGVKVLGLAITAIALAVGAGTQRNPPRPAGAQVHPPPQPPVQR